MRVLILLTASLSSTAMGGWVTLTRSGMTRQGGYFSEEGNGYGPSATPTGFVGWDCSGGNCDNKRMRAANGPNVLNSSGDSKTASNISEESNRNTMDCGDGRLLSRLQCRGGDCDDMNVWCRALLSNFRVDRASRVWTGWFSEENGGGQCGNNYWLWGFQCRGGRCDDQRLQCIKVQQFIPNNCAVNNWGAWGACDKECGGGSQTRSRTVRTQPEQGGQACPPLTETRECNTEACGPCTGIANKADNTRMRVKKPTAKKKVELVDKEADPICECYDLCAAEEGMAYYSYYIKKDKPTCQCYGTGKKLKLKGNKIGFISGWITQAAKTIFEKKNKGR